MNKAFTAHVDEWTEAIAPVQQRYDREYRNEAFDLPSEVESMPLFREWVSHTLSSKIASPFWELAQFQKNQRCLDIGCGVSFLIYPWRDWEVYFYGQEISFVAKDALNSRGSQLNSKLFKGVQHGAAHRLNYENAIFDRVIATGFSCYYPLAYWQLVLQEAKRVLKPNGLFIFDAIAPDLELAENWAILETYLGAEVYLTPLNEIIDLVRSMGGKITAQKDGALFCMYRVQW
ncbi:class I SAM-dependent methyltransferase [Pseudanabaena sp. FACHB-1277]|uniref:Class I SAM-dependent methyltransferase n=1 Tax=Pseudanabaena cinerea FACHB-1277 TaxID=2949581 RepID=A0A926USS7_9CYAN|nr:class I SAM-dependent methyltransferase [Pseudanabaena cinerea]MBD2150073.1 class I SAM-dependent methyltransferase [Pseudanabaena cinerea FACHB-1277]